MLSGACGNPNLPSRPAPSLPPAQNQVLITAQGQGSRLMYFKAHTSNVVYALVCTGAGKLDLRSYYVHLTAPSCNPSRIISDPVDVSAQGRFALRVRAGVDVHWQLSVSGKSLENA